MIVDSMTLEEIHKELQEDWDYAAKTSSYRAEAFRSVVLKSRTFPVRRSYECKTNRRKNRFYIQFTAVKRSDHKNPFVGYYSIYERPEGQYCAIVGRIEGFTVILPPHFFSRYRERVVRDNQISRTDLIHHFMQRDWGFHYASFPIDGREVFSDLDEAMASEAVDLVGVCTSGLFFGERCGDIHLIKTIVPGRMLFKNQYPLYVSLFKEYGDELSSKYPPKIVDYIQSLPDDYNVHPDQAMLEAYFQEKGQIDGSLENLRKEFKGK